MKEREVRHGFLTGPPEGGSPARRLVLGKKSGHIMLMLSETEAIIGSLGHGRAEPEKGIREPFVGMQASLLIPENLEPFDGIVHLESSHE